MLRVRDSFGIVLLVGMFLLGLYGLPSEGGSAYVLISVAVALLLVAIWLGDRLSSQVAVFYRAVMRARVHRARSRLLGDSVRPEGDAEQALVFALRAVEGGNYRVAAPILWREAEADEPLAQYFLSYLFLYGIVVPKSEEESIRWLSRAARRGLAEAAGPLAERLRRGAHRDPALAALWYERAALAGDGDAAAKLGELYDRGSGLPRSVVRAVHWWRKAAELGHGGAQVALGSAYLRGAGVERDRIQAISWLYLAVERGEERAARVLLRAQRDSKQEDREKATWLADHWRSRFHELTRPRQSRGEQRIINRKRRIQALARSFVVRLRDTLDHGDTNQFGVTGAAPGQAIPDIPSSARPEVSVPSDRADRVQPAENVTGLAEQPQPRPDVVVNQAAKETPLERLQRLRGGMEDRLARAEQRGRESQAQGGVRTQSGGGDTGKASASQSAAARLAESARNRLIAKQRQATVRPQAEGGRYDLSKNLRGSSAAGSEQSARRGSVREEA